MSSRPASKLITRNFAQSPAVRASLVGLARSRALSQSSTRTSRQDRNAMPVLVAALVLTVRQPLAFFGVAAAFWEGSVEPATATGADAARPDFSGSPSR